MEIDLDLSSSEEEKNRERPMLERKCENFNRSSFFFLLLRHSNKYRYMCVRNRK